MSFRWSGRRVLVTGASGIVGSWLTRDLILRNADVCALIRDDDPQSDFFRSGAASRTRVVTGELEDYATVERALNELEIDTVFHLGAQTIVGAAERAPLQTFKSNIEGSWNVLEASRRLEGLVERVVVASSDKAYGEQPELPYTEDMALLASHPYDASKACTDVLARSYAVTYGLPVGIARCGNIYGGADLNWSRIVPGTIRSILEGERPIVRSDGSYVRDYLYVKDAIDAYRVLAESLDRKDVQSEAFNFSTGSRVTVMEIVETIRKVMKSDLEPEVRNTARAEIKSPSLSPEKAKRVLGWSVTYDLERGLEETVRWYRDYLAR
jgi:CDP-glucose 4,6-dehydratase